VILNAHEGTWRMSLPLFILSILSLIIGYISKDLFIGFGANFWNSSIFVNPNNYIMTDIEFLELEYKLLPLFVTILGTVSAYYIYVFKIFEYYDFKRSAFAKKIFNFFNKKWYFDRVYNEIIVQKVLKESHYYFYQDIDRGLIEKLGPSGIVTFITSTVKNLKQYQSGQVLHYLSYFSVFFILFLLLLNKDFFIVTLLILVSFFSTMVLKRS